MKAPNEGPLGYWHALISQQYLQLLRRELAHLELDRWYFTLVYLAEAKGPITQQQLADELHLDKASMVRAIDHLSAKGYVQRLQCPNDRRKHHLALLPKALPALKEIKEAFRKMNDLAFANIKASDRKLIMDQLPLMLDRLKQADLAAKAPTSKTHK